jgi:hypothetical protein
MRELCTDTRMQARTCAHTHAHVRTHTNTHTHTHMRACTRTCTHPDTETHLDTDTHVQAGATYTREKERRRRCMRECMYTLVALVTEQTRPPQVRWRPATVQQIINAIA